MSAFDPDKIDQLGWRQGSVLGPKLHAEARAFAPAWLKVGDTDWLILTSHDCDVVNPRLEKEPFVEVIRAELVPRKRPDKQQAWGRNPRELQLGVASNEGSQVLMIRVHERWTLPREKLADEQPARSLTDKERRLISEWLAKRYIRAAFPTAFDARWRSKLRDWTAVLEKFSVRIQGAYLRLHKMAELPPEEPYKIALIIAVPHTLRSGEDWSTLRAEIDEAVENFWSQFTPGIELAEVEVLGTDEFTLADMEQFLRFDADWVSFADDTQSTPAAADMTA